MDFKELLDLIAIRGYVVNSVSNPIFDRATIKALNSIHILLDKKITGILTSDEFKNYIGFGGAQRVIQDIINEDKRPFTEARAVMSGIVTKKPR